MHVYVCMCACICHNFHLSAAVDTVGVQRRPPAPTISTPDCHTIREPLARHETKNRDSGGQGRLLISLQLWAMTQRLRPQNVGLGWSCQHKHGERLSQK